MLTLKQWLALARGRARIRFIVFAFRKGTRVKRNGRGDNGGDAPSPHAGGGRFTDSTGESDGGSHP
jgi:hypothetical protein